MLAALLGALFLLNAVPATAQTTVWSATLTVKDILSGIFVGCDNATSGTECSSTSVLTEDQFTHNGVTYDVTYLDNTASSGNVQIRLNKDIPGDFASFTLEVDSSSIGSPSSVSGVDMQWFNTGLSWTVNQQVSLSLAAPAYTLSVDANPPCGSTVTDTSLQPTRTLVLTPDPASETETEYQWVTKSTEGNWLGSLPIGTSGRSIHTLDNTFNQLRNAFPGFKGFRYRLANDHSVTAECFWTFSEQIPNTRTPTTDTPTTNTGGTGTGGGGGGGSPPKDTSSPDDDPAPDSPRCGESDREYLKSFYGATGGDAWDRNEHWNSQEPLEEWFGVKTDEDGEVISLRLENNNLSGDMPTEELRCLNENTELKELALWDNDDLSGEVPEDLALAVERAALREIADMFNINPEWFEDYEDPFNFEDWYEEITTDEDGRVVELELPGEIPESIRSQFKKRREITITTSDGGCAVGASSARVGASGLLVAVFMLLAVSRGLRARSD